MTIFRLIHRAEVTDAADDAREVTVCCSTATLGRDNIVAAPGCWVLDEYLMNPIWLHQHNPDWPIARSKQIAEDGQGNLIARVQFPPAGVSERADEVLGLIRAGVINAASTGFDVVSAEPIDPANPQAGTRITKAILQEVSFVSVPAVPDAVVTERAIKEIRRMAKKRADEDWRCGAAKDLPIDDSGEWDGQAAEDSVFEWAGGDDFDPAKARQGFLLYNAADDKLRGSYKLPIARVSDGELKAVSVGLRAAASRLPQTDAPEAELARAKDVLEAYEKKADIGDDADERRRLVGLRRAFAKRGLYEVGSLAYLLAELGWVKSSAEFEADIENDASKVPAMLGEALKSLGEALIAMTQEEVEELLGSVDVEVVPDEADDDEVEIAERTRSARLRAFRLGVHRAKKARGAKRRMGATHSLSFHRLKAERVRRDLKLSAG